MHSRTPLVILLILLCSNGGKSQDVEPRRWANLPLDKKVIGMGYSYTFGDVLFDPLLEVEDAIVRAHTGVVSYVQPFRIGKKFARLDVLVPFSSARWEGLLKGEFTSIERTGLLDPRIRFSYHIIGPPPSKLKELQEYLASNSRYTTVGISLSVNLPLGQYNEDYLINLGFNQFVFRPQIGVSHTWGSWSAEANISAYIYTENPNFYNDGVRRQDPLFASQAHLIKQFKNRMWISISSGYGLGGISRVNRLSKDDKRSNLLSAASFGFPLVPGQSAKIVYINASTLEDIGSNTHSLLLAYTILF